MSHPLRYLQNRKAYILTLSPSHIFQYSPLQTLLCRALRHMLVQASWPSVMVCMRTCVRAFDLLIDVPFLFFARMDAVVPSGY